MGDQKLKAHDRYGGRGAPPGLPADEIPLSAGIIAVAEDEVELVPVCHACPGPKSRVSLVSDQLNPRGFSFCQDL